MTNLSMLKVKGSNPGGGIFFRELSSRKYMTVRGQERNLDFWELDRGQRPRRARFMCERVKTTCTCGVCPYTHAPAK